MNCTIPFLCWALSLAKTHIQFPIKIAHAGREFAADMSICAYTPGTSKSFVQRGTKIHGPPCLLQRRPLTETNQAFLCSKVHQNRQALTACHCSVAVHMSFYPTTSLTTRCLRVSPTNHCLTHKATTCQPCTRFLIMRRPKIIKNNDATDKETCRIGKQKDSSQCPQEERCFFCIWK